MSGSSRLRLASGRLRGACAAATLLLSACTAPLEPLPPPDRADVQSRDAHAPVRAPPPTRRAAPGPPRYEAVGIASWYGARYHGRRTASGERFDMHAATAAHRTLPFGSVVRVTNLANGRSAVVRINDRGPFIGGRIIDVSRRVAEILGFVHDGTVRVRIEFVQRAQRRPVAQRHQASSPALR